MKKILFAIVFLFLFSITAFAEEKNSQKFNVVFTIEYRDMTLKQIAEIENKIKSEFEKAYSIKIKFEHETPIAPWPYILDTTTDVDIRK